MKEITEKHDGSETPLYNNDRNVNKVLPLLEVTAKSINYDHQYSRCNRMLKNYSFNYNYPIRLSAPYR